jgi:hypothetical protein
MLSWSLDGKWVYVSLRHFPFGSSQTAVIPVKSGARLINQDEVSLGMTPNYSVNKRRSAKVKLFRIYLEQ